MLRASARLQDSAGQQGYILAIVREGGSPDSTVCSTLKNESLIVPGGYRKRPGRFD